MEWPSWWAWDLELTPHLERRMEDRDFTEVDLRGMLEKAEALDRDIVEGRWLVRSTHDGSTWEIIVEPDWDVDLLVVITAYRAERGR